jgi:LemA protein
MAWPYHSAAASKLTKNAQLNANAHKRDKLDWRRLELRRMLQALVSVWSTFMVIWVILAIVVAIAAWAILMYNNLVALRNRVSNAFSQIDVQLTRRYDLIPNLIEAVKGYMSHERGTLEAVIEARNAAVSGLKRAAQDPTDPDAIKALAAAETTLGGTLGRLFALSEAYPELKANENMMQFQEELATTENKVAFSRQAFNDSVMTYNNACQSFPSNLVANNFGFKHAEFLEIETETKREVPKVSFN